VSAQDERTTKIFFQKTSGLEVLLHSPKPRSAWQRFVSSLLKSTALTLYSVLESAEQGDDASLEDSLRVVCVSSPSYRTVTSSYTQATSRRMA
jgi:hypothetical protein